MPADMLHLTWRTEPQPLDESAVRRIVTSTGFFSPAEADVACELVRERLARGDASGYYFVLASLGEQVVGYACYGPIACTVASFDLYWIAVHADHDRRGIGRRMLAEAERRIAAAGGRRIYVETSSRSQYEPTRAFYARCGYHVEATLADFYAPGDGKVVLVKVLENGAATARERP